MDTDNFTATNKLFTGNIDNEEVRIKVVGVGGGGNNAVDRLQLDGLPNVRCAAINTDAQSLSNSPIAEKCMIGRSITRGLSAGGEPEIGRKCAMTDRDRISVITSGMDMIFIVAGLGGGTGSGAAPVVAELASEQGALVIAFATLPFTMEGARRREQANEAMVELRKYCDAVIPLPNDLLLQLDGESTTVLDSFAIVDDWIARGIQSICSMVLSNGLINIDFSSLRKAFAAKGGKTLFGLGKAEGENYVKDALNDLMLCPLLHLPDSAVCADKLLVNVIGGTDLNLAKINELVSTISETFKSFDNTVLGAVIDEQKQQSLEICVVGTTDVSGHKRISLTEEPVVKDEKPPLPKLPSLVPQEEIDPVEEALESAEIEQEEVVAEESISLAQDELVDVPPQKAPELPQVDRSEAIPVHESKLKKKKQKTDPEDQEVFGFMDEDQQRGYFDNTERNFFDGEDLDVPTYLRRGIKIVL